MGIWTRHYLLQDDSTLKRIARRVVDGLALGEDAILEYAGTQQRVIQVLVESEDRKPVRILDVTGSYWTFDAHGKVDESLRRAGAEWQEFAFASRRPKRTGSIVDLVPELKRKDLHARLRWTVSQDDIDRIAADLWPGIHGPAPDITSVKGKAPRRPPLTGEARDALREIGSSVSSIDHRLGALTEPGLKGLAFEADRHGTFEDEALWRGVAEHARHRRAILAAHRTGRGVWYAVIEAFRAEAGHISRSVATAHVKADGQKAAIEAGRKLMVEKADWLGPETTIEVSICSALEWQPVED